MAVISITDRDSVRTITMDRPDALNAFNADMMHELCEAFLAAASDPLVKVLILTGRGRAFSAGADLKSMGTPATTGRHDLNALMDAIITFPKPFLIAANGLGVGIGMTICGVADMTFMAESARFKAPFSALGLTAEAASTYTFSRLMGHQAAAWVLMSSEWFTSAQCHAMGLALEVVADEALMDTVNARADLLASLPLASLMRTKALMQAPHIEAMKAAVMREGAGLASLAGGAANREALSAFLAKREPDFTGL